MIDVPIQVKDALREGRLRKNYRFQVLNDDGTVDFTIDNNNLVSESVNIDERMCSGDKIQYGLCEGSSLEFQYFGKENITGRQLKVFVDVEYGESTPYAIPMGYFTVKNCSRQASTGIIKVTAYNKLMSEYLDNKANELVVSAFYNQQSVVTISDIKRLALSNYEIEQSEVSEVVHAQTGYGLPMDDGVSNTKLTTFYGDMGPLGPLNCGIVSPSDISRTFKFMLESNDLNIYTLDPTKYYRINSIYNLDDYELSFYEYLKNIIDDSKMNVAGSTYLSTMIKNMYVPLSPTVRDKTWGKFFAIRLIKEDDTEEYYSIVCLQNGVTSINVKGTMNDLKLRTFTGYKEMHIYTPQVMGYYTGSEAYLNTEVVHFVGDGDGAGVITYMYREDASHYISYGSYPAFKQPNGEAFPKNWINPDLFLKVVEVDGLSPAELLSVQVDTLPDYTLREIISASYETVCQFGQLDRVTDLFSGVELNHSRLLPADTLYPDNALYPSGAQESAFRSQYSKLWADEGNVRKWRYLIITYKGLDENQQEKDFILQRTINNDGTDDYNCSDNWLFRNLIWTATDIGSYADAMVAKMQDITWFPFEMWCAGLPYLETGDEIEIPLGEDTYTSYILQRQLKGIQNLQDTYINGTLDIF